MQWIELKQKNGSLAPDELAHCRVTPLMAAASGKRLACCSLLLCVSKKDAVDAEQRSALDRAEQDDEQLKSVLA